MEIDPIVFGSAIIFSLSDPSGSSNVDTPARAFLPVSIGNR